MAAAECLSSVENEWPNKWVNTFPKRGTHGSICKTARHCDGYHAGGAALTAAVPAVQAQAQAAAPGQISLPCSVTALKAAITFADTHGGGVFQLAANCTYLISTPATAADGLPIITAPISLVGAPHTVLSRDTLTPLFRVLEVAAGGTLQVSNVSIQNGNTAGLGGGLLNAGTLRLSQVVLSGNRAGNGAGVSNSASGAADITSTTFSGNTTTGVGGGGIINSGTLTVVRSTFTANTAPIKRWRPEHPGLGAIDAHFQHLPAEHVRGPRRRAVQPGHHDAHRHRGPAEPGLEWRRDRHRQQPRQPAQFDRPGQHPE